jgi:hypothetical protein
MRVKARVTEAFKRSIVEMEIELRFHVPDQRSFKDAGFFNGGGRKDLNMRANEVVIQRTGEAPFTASDVKGLELVNVPNDVRRRTIKLAG